MTSLKVPGTNISLVPPPGFVSATTHKGFIHPTTDATIMIVEMPIGIQAMKGFTAEELKPRGMTLLDKRDVYIHEIQATLVKVRQEANRIQYIKHMLVLGDSSKVVLVTGAYPEEHAVLEERITASLLSVGYYGPKQEKPDTGIPNLDRKENWLGGIKGYTLEGIMRLPAWAGFLNKPGEHKIIEPKRSDEKVAFTVEGEIIAGKPRATQEQIATYQYILANAELIRDNILTALLQGYQELQAHYGYEEEELMPDVTEIAQFKEIIRLSGIHILDVYRDGIAYVGYQFHCPWDEEHELGFMTHKDRVVEFGGADTAVLSWIAKQDLGAE